MQRREFVRCLPMALVAATACRGSDGVSEDPRAGLVRLLGLEPAESGWLDALNDQEQRELHAALSVSPARISTRTIDLTLKVIGRRDRLFPYVGYPSMPNAIEGCDGLIRE
jgi:hypothetical protein